MSVDPLAALLRSPGLFLASVLLAHGVARVWISPSVEWDDAEQLLHGQFLLWGYGPQPPLFEWVSHVLFGLFGYGVGPLVAFKSLLLLAIYGAIAGGLRRLGQSREVAAVAALSTFTLAMFCWEALRMRTHTVLAAACVAGMFWVLASIVASSVSPADHRGARPSTRGAFDREERKGSLPEVGRFLLLGLLAGAGLLSKHSVGPAVFLMVLAALGVRGWRYQLWRPGLALAVAVALAMLAPHAHWAWGQRAMVFQGTVGKFASGGDTPPEWIEALGNYLSALFSFLGLPILLLTAFILVDVLRRLAGNPGSSAARLVTSSRPETKEAIRAWALNYLALFAVFSAVLILAFRPHRFQDHWFTPFLMWLPALAVVLLAADSCWLQRVRAAATITIAVAALALLARVPVAGITGSLTPLTIPADRLGAAIADLVDERTVLLASPMHLAGGLRLHSRAGEVYAVGSPLLRLRARGGCDVLLVRLSGEGRPRPEWSMEDLRPAAQLLDLAPEDLLAALEGSSGGVQGVGVSRSVPLGWGRSPVVMDAARFVTDRQRTECALTPTSRH